jgi:hypothetical protein
MVLADGDGVKDRLYLATFNWLRSGSDGYVAGSAVSQNPRLGP